jgi:pentatricopeptide repeat domain-containing protein 2
LDIYKEIVQKEFKWASRKSIVFLAALAIKQNVPHIAVEIISTIRPSRYIDVKCLKIMAYADLKKFDETVPILRMSLENDQSTVKDIFFYDVVCIQCIINSYNSCKKTSHYIIFY